MALIYALITHRVSSFKESLRKWNEFNSVQINKYLLIHKQNIRILNKIFPDASDFPLTTCCRDYLCDWVSIRALVPFCSGHLMSLGSIFSAAQEDRLYGEMIEQVLSVLVSMHERVNFKSTQYIESFHKAIKKSMLKFSLRNYLEII